MDSKKVASVVSSIMLSAALAGCYMPKAFQKATATPYPTYTPYPIPTAYPTYTPFPSATPTAEPTVTPQADMSVVASYKTVDVDSLYDYKDQSVCIKTDVIMLDSHDPLSTTITLAGMDSIATVAFGRNEELEEKIDQAIWWSSRIGGFEICGKVLGSQPTQYMGGLITQHILIGDYVLLNGYPHKLPSFEYVDAPENF